MGNKVIRCGFFLAKIKGVKPYGEIMLEWEAYFEPHILERGISYARNGAVQFISFLLVQDYSEPILQEYCKYVSSLADYARNRASYDELKRYLMRMQQYNGGSDLVRTLCKEWINKYPTRKVMVQELRTMLGSLLTSG